MGNLKVDNIQGSTGSTITIPAGQTLDASAATVSLPTSANFTSTGIDDNATSTAITIDANENVGIGVTSPAKQVHIGSASGGTLRLSSSNTSVGAGESLGEIDFYSNDSSSLGSGVRGFIKCVENDAGVGRAYDLILGTGNVGEAVEVLRVDKDGNVGIGVTPENWSSVASALDIGIGGALVASATSGVGTQVVQNAYFDGAWKYKTTEPSVRYQLSEDGKHLFYVTSSGTADTAISWQTAMTIDNSGNVGIGVTPESGWDAANFSVLQLGSKMAVFSQDTAHQAHFASNQYVDGVGDKYLTTDFASNYYQVNGTHVFRVAASGTADTAISWTTATKINNDGSQEWGTFSATGASLGRRVAANGITMESSVSPTTASTHHSFYNPNGLVGTIKTSASATQFNTSSDPRLKSAFSAVTEEEAFALVDAYSDPSVCGRFHFLADPTKDTIGFNAHAMLDLPFGDSIATEGEGPRNLALGEEYDTGEVDENGDPIMATVTPAGVDQSKPVPGMMIAMGHLVNKARKFDTLSALLVTKGVLTQAEVDAL